MELPELRITTYRGSKCFTYGSGSQKRRWKIKDTTPAAMEQQKWSIIRKLTGLDAEVKKAATSIEDVIEEHIASCRASEAHMALKRQRLLRIIRAAGVTRLDQLDDRIEAAIRGLRKIPHNPKADPETYPLLSQRSRNHYRKAIKQLARWAYRKGLTDTQKLLDMDTELVTIATKRVRFQPDEVVLLINAAAESVRTIETYDGKLRSILYATAVSTALRRRELGFLTPESFDFSSDPPMVRVPATGTKNKQAAAQPISERMIPPLKEFLADCEPGQPIFPGLTRKEPPKTSKMINNDMEEACIPKVVAAGTRTFHGLRATYGSVLADAGLDIHEVRALMRHACITTSAQYVTPPSDLARRAANILPIPPIWDQG